MLNKKKIKIKIIDFKIILFLTIATSIKADYLNMKPKGFIWYEMDNKNYDHKTVRKTESNQRDKLELESKEAKSRNLQLKKDFENALELLLDKPTIENANLAQSIQRKIFKRSSEVSKIWLMASMLSMKNNNEIDNPNILHRKILRTEKEKNDIELLKEISKNWGLVLYVKKGCLFSSSFLEIINELFEITSFKILVISDNSYKYGNFIAKKENNIIRKINPKLISPALFLLHKDGIKIYPITIGISDISKIMSNIINIYNYDKGIIND